MPIVVGLLVTLAIDKYQERQALKNAAAESNREEDDYGSFVFSDTTYLLTIMQETGITSLEEDRRREEAAFHELQNYADFQRALSSKVLNDLSADDAFSPLYSSGFSQYNMNRSLGDKWYDSQSNVQYTILGHLPCPIIIPQKASGSDGLGWVRSYSPALMECGISQQSFLELIDSFNTSLRVSLHSFDMKTAPNLSRGYSPS